METAKLLEHKRTFEARKALDTQRDIQLVIKSKNLLLTNKDVYIPKTVYTDVLRSKSYVLLKKYLDLHSNDFEYMQKILECAIETKYSVAIKQIIDKFPKGDKRIRLLGEALVSSYKLKLFHVMKMLIEAGADIHVKNNMIPKELVRTRQNEQFKIFIKYMDINLNDGELLQIAFHNHDATMVKLLLDSGLLDTYSDTMTINEYGMLLLNQWRKNNRITRLVRAIKMALCKDVFKWQKLARMKSNNTDKLLLNLYDLERFINTKSIDDHVHYTKRALCARLSKLSDLLLIKDGSLDGYDLCGNSLSSLPKYKLITLNGRTYNLIDLVNIIRRGSHDGKCICPYTRSILPKEVIIERYNHLKRILSINSLIEPNLLECVQNTHILTPMTELKYQLVDIFAKLSYVPSISVISDARDSTIDDMMYKLFIVTREHPQYYKNITQNTLDKLKSLTGISKKMYFVNLIEQLLNYQDNMYSSRTELLSILLRHYKEDGTTHYNDTLTWMLETLDNSIMMDYTPWFQYEFSI